MATTDMKAPCNITEASAVKYHVKMKTKKSLFKWRFPSWCQCSHV